MDPAVVVTRFACAFVCSLAFGLARQRLGKPIGFGTFIFVGLGSCALALTAISHNSDNPLPLLGAIVTGIGFLGAGALFRTADRVVGFTSAATIWVFAVFGLAIGLGEYLIGGLVYGSILAVVAIDRWLETRWIGAHERKLSVELALDTSEEELRELGLPTRASAQTVTVDREKGQLLLTYSLKRPRGEAKDLLRRLESSPQVRRTSFESS